MNQVDASYVKDLEADARRWKYVCNHLAQMYNPRMNSEHAWRFRTLYYTGPTVAEAIDKGIAEEENGRIE